MGLIQNKVTVSQPTAHIVVKDAGGLRGLTGPQGEKGEQGNPGTAATVNVGSTTTLPAGSNATVQNVGSIYAATLNFGIPKGDKGDTGDAGAAATISVGSTSTLPAGSSATVTNSGTSSAAVFDFGIPKGAKGDTGSQGLPGQDGADGFSPTATVSKTGDTATITITDKDGTTTAQISDGVTPTVDSALSPTSENPVQNKVVTAALATKGEGDMKKSVYDTNDNGIVDDSEKVNGHTVEDDVPAGFFSGEATTSGSGTNIELDGTIAGGAIESVEMYGDTEQTTYSGKNLYEGSPSFDSYNSISAWEDGGTYNGMPVIKRAAAWTGAYRLINIEAGVTYTFSAWVKSDEARPVAIYAIGSGATATITPNNKNITTTTNWERVSFTFTCSTSGTVALRFENTSASTTNYTYISGYQLEKNSSATSFEPYVGGMASPNPDYPQEVQTVTGRQVVTISDDDNQSQEYEINLGKNLLPYPYVETTTTKNGITFTVNSDGSVTVSGTATSAAWFKLSESMTLPSGCFMSGCPSGGSTTKYSLQTSYSGTVFGDYGSGVQLQAGTADPVWIVVRSGQDFSTPVTFYPQIEKGTSKSSYAPYFTPIELCKIGDYQDYIYKSGNDWYVHKETNKIDLDGSTEGTWWYGDESGHERFIVTYADIATQSPYAANTPKIQYSNYFEGSNGYHTYTGDMNNIMSGHHNNHQIIIRATQFTSLAAFTNWLGTNKPSMYYVKATPTDTQITNSALIAQLDALNAGNTYDGTTVITVSSENLAGSLEITVYKKTLNGIIALLNSKG